MPHEQLRLTPGVNTVKTPTLNVASISESQLIRQMLDGAGSALVQKLGGWARYFSTAMPTLVRAMQAWQDLNSNKYLAAGCEPSATPGTGSYLEVIKNGTSLIDISPRVEQTNVTVDLTTVAGTNIITITDTGTNVSAYDSVFIPAHISIAGVIVFGFYPCIAVGANTYDIALYDSNGNPVLAASSETNDGAVAVFDTTSGSQVVEVTLPDHGYFVGDTYPVLISTAVGGVTLNGNYLVQTVIDADTFTIYAPSNASSSDTQSINGGEARYNYYLGFGPLPTGTGFGVGGFGRGGFGTGVAPTSATGDNIDTLDWVLDAWGEILIALPTDTTFGSSDNASLIGGPLYYWSPSANTYNALAIAAGPIASTSFFIAMPQRQIIALGTSVNGVQDPLLIRWCDNGNFNVWVPTPINSARSYRIPRGSKIVGGLQAGQQGIVWTDLACWAMQFIGGDSVYGFNEIASGCGLIARKAAATLGTSTYWMGLNQFFVLTGDGVQPLPCSVWDNVFQNLDTDNLRKIRCAPNSSFNEITWYYPSLNGGGEVDSYVKLNTAIGPANGWDYGLLCRTAWINQSVLGQPIGADQNALIQQHEISNDADGVAMMPSFTTGYFVLSEGDVLMFVDQFWPDMKWGQYGSTPNTQLMLTFHVVEYPGQTPRSYGPFTLQQATTYITPRFRGRLVSLEFSSNDVGTFWRVGANRYRYAADGKFL